MDHADHDVGLIRREAREIGFRADDRERTLVDRGAVAEIRVFSAMVGSGERRMAVPRRAKRDSDTPGGARASSRAMRNRCRQRVGEGDARLVGRAGHRPRCRSRRGAHDRERAGARMRAALGAAGDVDRQRAVEQLGGRAARSAAPAHAPEFPPTRRSARPAQATMRRRGSSGRTMKPRRSARRPATARLSAATTDHQQSATGRGAQTAGAGARARPRSGRASVSASVWPKARPMPSASCRRVTDAGRSVPTAGERRLRRRSINRTAIAARNVAGPSR